MNVHHLELFYYVARFGGISEAVRKMPYGIQQPALSGQILQLEDSLGVTLFQRRPFVLTASGKELYAFAEPFFSRLGEVAEQVSGGAAQLVRMAASSIVLKAYLPDLMKKVRVRFPNLKLVLKSSLQSDVAGALDRQEIDLAVTSIDGKLPAGMNHEVLLSLPLVLVVERKSPIKSAADLFSRDRISSTLIGLPQGEPISRLFQMGLSKQKVHWPVGIEVNSLDLIESYVASGFGVAVAVDLPGQKWNKEIRLLPLEGFTPLVMAVLWKGKLSGPHQHVVDECVAKARELSGESGGGAGSTARAAKSV